MHTHTHTCPLEVFKFNQVFELFLLHAQQRLFESARPVIGPPPQIFGHVCAHRNIGQGDGSINSGASAGAVARVTAAVYVTAVLHVQRRTACDCVKVTAPNPSTTLFGRKSVSAYWLTWVREKKIVFSSSHYERKWACRFICSHAGTDLLPAPFLVCSLTCHVSLVVLGRVQTNQRHQTLSGIK